MINQLRKLISWSLFCTESLLHLMSTFHQIITGLSTMLFQPVPERLPWQWADRIRHHQYSMEWTDVVTAFQGWVQVQLAKDFHFNESIFNAWPPKISTSTLKQDFDPVEHSHHAMNIRKIIWPSHHLLSATVWYAPSSQNTGMSDWDGASWRRTLRKLRN